MFGFDFLQFGQRIYAQDQWWIGLKYFAEGYWAVVHPNAIMPAPMLLVKQSDKDRLYQKILFKKF